MLLWCGSWFIESWTEIHWLISRKLPKNCFQLLPGPGLWAERFRLRLPAILHKKHNRLLLQIFQHYNSAFEDLAVTWQRCLQRGIFSKHFIGSFRSSSFFFMWRVFFLSVRCPELKDVKMTKCSNHSWIQIVLSLVGAASVPMIVSCLAFLCWRVQCSMGVGEGCHLFFLVSFGPWNTF